MERSRNYCFTLNNYTEDDVKSILDISDRYVIFGREVGESGTPHLQGFISFKSQRYFKSVKSLMPRAHIEVAKGSVDDNYKYCSKGGDFTEQGTKPLSQKEKGDCNVERFDSAYTAAMEGRWEDIPKDIRFKYEKGLEYIVRKDKRRANPPVVLDHTLQWNEWWYGPPKSGKSLGVRKLAEQLGGGLYVKDPTTVWWDGYEGQENVVIDDFDKYQVKQGGDMKRWMDIYPFQAQVKGCQTLLRPKRVFVTSNYHINEIWDDTVTVEAISRRCKLVPVGVMEPDNYAPCFKRAKTN